MESYPYSALPLPSLRQLSAANQANVARTEMETGRFKTRMRFVNTLDFFSVSILLDAFQTLVWDEFHKYTISQGADYFLLPLRIYETVELYQVRIVGEVNSQHDGDSMWTVSFQIEIEDMIVQYRGISELIEALGEEYRQFPEYVNELHKVVHEDFPAVYN